MRLQIRLLRIGYQWAPLLFRRIYYWTTLSGSSVRRALFTALIVNAVILPLLYWSTGAARAGTSGRRHTGFLDVLILSLANVVSLSTSSAHIVTEWASVLQVLQAISGYFILAFIVWVAQRFQRS